MRVLFSDKEGNFELMDVRNAKMVSGISVPIGHNNVVDIHVGSAVKFTVCVDCDNKRDDVYLICDDKTTARIWLLELAKEGFLDLLDQTADIFAYPSVSDIVRIREYVGARGRK